MTNKFEVLFSGLERVVWEGHKSWHTTDLPAFVTKQYKNLLLDIAQLDEKLFLLLNETYDEIIELEHYRKITVNFFCRSRC